MQKEHWDIDWEQGESSEWLSLGHMWNIQVVIH